MKRPSIKLIGCIHCATPSRVDSECVRYLCGECALKGRDFPRERTLEMFADLPPSGNPEPSPSHSLVLA